MLWFRLLRKALRRIRKACFKAANPGNVSLAEVAVSNPCTFGNPERKDSEFVLADIFTKSLGRERIESLINKLGMRSFTPETLKKLADDVDE
ncbi:hypothetical protein Tco_0640167 [Tanacetum coccineum]